MLDLNEIPLDQGLEAPLDSGHGGDAEPAYCTPVTLVDVREGVGESPATIDIADNEPLREDTYVVAPVAGRTIVVAEHSGGVAQDTSGVAENADGVTPNTAGVACEAPANIEQELEYSSQPQEPYLGMRFDTLVGAKEHYNAYARVKGFSIKSNTSRRSAYTNLFEKQQFVCNKFRKPKNVDDAGGQSSKVRRKESSSDEDPIDATNEDSSAIKKVVKRRRRESIKQTECKAKMTVKLMDGRWQVIFFVAEHNHELITRPSLTKYLLSHKNISPEEEEFIRLLDDCNLQTGQMMTLLSRFYANGLIVPYTTKTISNFRSKIRSERKGDDMAEIVSYFMAKQKEDPTFYFNVKMDEDERVELLFWVDGLARKAYTESYHDCISFDTTYLTNQYNMPFAPFIGINRHGQSFMLGCGFMRDETASSFDWLLEKYLDAMDGRAPLNIITNQDYAMRASIAKLFPNTVHRNCRWHIMKKAQEKLGSFLGRRPGLSQDFNECIDMSMTPPEFEQNWAALVANHRLEEHADFAHLYSIRKTWVPCYFRQCFFPFLQSTQHSEGFNAVLKRYVNPHNSILNFVKQYEKIQVKILVKEGGNDYRIDHLTQCTWSAYPIEKQAFAVYTRDIYVKFRDEFMLMGRYNVRPQPNGLYQPVPNMTYCQFYGARSYLVLARVQEEEYICECGKMNRDGLLCCHILKVFTHLGIDEIPERFIMRRWTQNTIPGEPARRDEAEPDALPPESLKQMRMANLSVKYGDLAKIGCCLDAANAIAEKYIHLTRTEINHLNLTRRKDARRRRDAAARSANEASASAAPATAPRHSATSARTSATAPHRSATSAPTSVAPPRRSAAASCDPAPAAASGAIAPHPSATTLVNPATAYETSGPHPSGAANLDTTIAAASEASASHPLAIAAATASASIDPSRVRNRDRCPTKGRPHKRRLENALELHPKKRNRCILCNSDEHNAARCPLKIS